MNKRQVITLWSIALALGATVAVVKFTQQKSTDSATKRTPGQTLFDHFPAAETSTIEILGATGTTTLNQKDGKWTIAQRDAYPANARIINELLRTVSELKIAQGIEAGPSFAPRFGIDETATDPLKRGTTVAFKDGTGKELAKFSIGKSIESGASANPMAGGATGRFVRNHSDDSGFYTVSETFPNVVADPKSWLDHTFVQAEKLKSISVTAPGKEEVAWTLTRTDENSAFTLDGQALDPNGESQLKTLFAFTRFEDVVSAEQMAERSLSDQKRTAVLETFEGITYTISFWPTKPVEAPAADDSENPMPPAADNFFLTVDVSGEPIKERVKPADEKEEDAKVNDTAFAERLKTLNEKLEKEKTLAGRTFEVSKFTVDQLLKDRAELLPQPAPAADPTGQVPPGLAPPPQPASSSVVTPTMSFPADPAKDGVEE